jgi:hypothetical protein
MGDDNGTFRAINPHSTTGAQWKINRYFLCLQDSAGKQGCGYVGGPGNGETLGSDSYTVDSNAIADARTEANATTGYTNNGSATFESTASGTPSAGSYHFHVVGDSIYDGFYKTAKSYPFTAGRLYKTNYDIKVVSGNAACQYPFGDYDSPITSATYVSNTKYKTATLATYDTIGCSCRGVICEFYSDNWYTKQVTDINTTGVHLHSTPSATDRKMARIDSGFLPNSVTTYKLYCVQGLCLGDDYDLVRQSVNNDKIILNPFTGKYLQRSP